jgi:hypothetical protein
MGGHYGAKGSSAGHGTVWARFCCVDAARSAIRLIDRTPLSTTRRRGYRRSGLAFAGAVQVAIDLRARHTRSSTVQRSRVVHCALPSRGRPMLPTRGSAELSWAPRFDGSPTAARGPQPGGRSHGRGLCEGRQFSPRRPATPRRRRQGQTTRAPAIAVPRVRSRSVIALLSFRCLPAALGVACDSAGRRDGVPDRGRLQRAPPSA